jgi:hypothetical protein
MLNFLNVLFWGMGFAVFALIAVDVVAGFVATYRGRDRRKTPRPGNAPRWGSHVHAGQ